jgi:anthranilate phosphoribosyltransferase
MRELIKEVGRGKRGAKDLPYEEALRGARLILSGEATPAQTAAFLMAERIKLETADEILAFVEALRERSLRHPIADSLDVSGPYDGKKRSFFASFPVAFVLAACGVPVTLHGSRSLPPKWGITLSDILHVLGIDTQETEPFIKAAQQTGVLYAHAETWNKDWASLRQIREELGVRTLVSTAEKLVRYSDAPYMATGVFHGTFFEKTAEVISRSGIRRGLIVQGTEGSADITVHQLTRTLFVHGDEKEFLIIDPEIYGVRAEVPEIEWTAQTQADTALQVLQGEADVPFYNMVVLNSAVRLWIVQKVHSIEEGIEVAKDAIQQGKALASFEEWKHIVS